MSREKIHMTFRTRSGKNILVPAGSRAMFWEVQDGLIAEARLLKEPMVPYAKCRTGRPGLPATAEPAEFDIDASRSLRHQDLKRLDDASFAKLDVVLLRLATRPLPPRSKPLKWLRPDVWWIRAAGYPVVYAVDQKARRIHLLRVGFCRQV